MRAAIVEHYGPPAVVRVVDREPPTPRRGQVMVRVRAAAVTSGDARIRGASFPPGFTVPARVAFGLRGPRRQVLGSAFSGEVVALGPDVRDVAVGDEVCGMAGTAMGAHAELLAVDARRVVPRPATVSREDAAGVLFGGTTAWYFLHDRAKVGAGTSVLVNGASGAIGTNAVQLAAHLGATVTGVSSAANAGLVKELGADRVIDYTVQPVTEVADRFDVVFDTVGNLTIASGRRLLTPGGVLILAVASLGETVRARGDVVAGAAPERVEDMTRLVELVAGGQLRVVLDQVLDLEHIADAHARVDSGHKVGNVLVRP